LELSGQVDGMLIRLHDLSSEINVSFLEYYCASSYFSSTSSSTVTGCVLDGRCWVQFPAGIPPTHTHTLNKPPNQGISGTLFPVVQQLGHEADWWCLCSESVKPHLNFPLISKGHVAVLGAVMTLPFTPEKVARSLMPCHLRSG